MRAIAAKQARERDLKARLAIADAVIDGFRKGAQCAGKHHYYGFVEQFGAYVGDEETRELIIKWWLEKGYPTGPDYNPE